MSIQNRFEFMYYVACTDCNPNGDPDMGNMPRLDPQTMQGELAHRGEPGMNIIIQQSTNINRYIAEAKREAGVEDCAKAKESVYAGRKKACEMFYDVRTFGAVMSTGPNAGQVRGPVQITFGKSVDPVLPLDISITRMAVADKLKDGATVEDYKKWEEEQSEDKLRTMGREELMPFGLYEVRGCVSGNLAEETGFDDDDLNTLFEAILNMYEHDRSASKGEMEVVSPLIIFKHIGTDTDADQRKRQAKLGCAPAHRLFDLVKVSKKDSVTYPRTYRDYDASVAIGSVPAGVQIGFKPTAFEPIVWDKLPEDENWFRRG